MAPWRRDLVSVLTGTSAGICGACRSGMMDEVCASDLCAADGAAASSTTDSSRQRTYKGQARHN